MNVEICLSVSFSWQQLNLSDCALWSRPADLKEKSTLNPHLTLLRNNWGISFFI